MILYFIFLISLLLFLFSIQKKKIKNDIIESPIKPKKNGNVIEYFTNPEEQQCLRHTRIFNKEKNKITSKIIENKAKNINENLNPKIKEKYDDMIELCGKYPNNCEIHDLKKLCTNIDGENNCELVESSQRDNGSYLVKFRKIETETWGGLNIFRNEIDVLVKKGDIKTTDSNYEKITPLNYIFNYEPKYGNSFLDYISSAIHLSKVPQYKLKNFYSVSPGESSNAFKNINLLGKILKCIYQFQELETIFTDKDIDEMKKEEDFENNSEDTLINSTNYIITKWNEINDRVDSMIKENKINLIKIELQNKAFPLEIQVEKNLWNYCKFKNQIIESFNKDSPRIIQNQINNEEYPISVLEKKCKKAGGEFVTIPTLTDNNNNDRHYCISRDNFVNINTKYMEAYLDNNGKIINKVNFDTQEEFEKEIKNKKTIKNGIRSCDRIFDLEYDYVAKECAKKFNNNGCLGSTYNPETKEYNVSSCINSNIQIDPETNKIKNEDELDNKFYIIDSNYVLIETIKKYLDTDYIEDQISEKDYNLKLKECSRGAETDSKGNACEPEDPPFEYIGNNYKIGDEKISKKDNKTYVVKEKTVMINFKEQKKKYWEVVE
jgi:hypothetical protein